MTKIKELLKLNRITALVLIFALSLPLASSLTVNVSALTVSEDAQIIFEAEEMLAEELLQAEPEPRSLTELKKLDGVTLGSDGQVISVKQTEENGITDAEVELLIYGKVLNGEYTYTPSYDGYYELGLTDDNIAQAIRLHGDANNFNFEITVYKASIAELDTDEAFERDVLDLICSGYTCGQAFGAYASSEILEMSITELAEARVEEIEEEIRADAEELWYTSADAETAKTAAASKSASTSIGASEDEEEEDSEIRELATRMGVPYRVVEGFMESYNGTAEELEIERKNVREETFEAMQLESDLQLQSDEPMTTMAAASSDTFYYPEEVLEKNYTYNTVGSIDVNVNTGDYVYSETDLSIPGDNGLDLNITRIFSSAYSYAQLPLGRIVSNTTQNCVQLQYRLYIKQSDSTGFVSYVDVTNEGYSLNSPRDTALYSISNGAMLVKYKSSQYFIATATLDLLNADCYYSEYSGRSPSGATVGITLIPVLIGLSAYYDEYFINYNIDSYNYTVNEYGLGHGWRLGFSAIESYTVGSDVDTLESKKRLITSDGRRYEIDDPDVYGNASANYSNLVDYVLQDMKVFKVRNITDYPDAQYALFHADGKIEYFNAKGRNIAIVDRYGNAITLVYTYSDTSKNNVSSITITDTIGNVIVYKNENLNAQDAITIRVPHQSNSRGISCTYNAKWTLSMNGSVVRTYYCYDSRATSGNYSYLSYVEDETGEYSIITKAANSLSFDSFVSNVSTSTGVLYQVRLANIYYPNGLVKSVSQGDINSDTVYKRYGLAGCIKAYCNTSIQSSRIYAGEYEEVFEWIRYDIRGSGDYRRPAGFPYYTQVTEYKTSLTDGGSRAGSPAKISNYCFDAETHLKSSVSVYIYPPVDELSLRTDEEVRAFWATYSVQGKSSETSYTYHSTYKLPTAITTKYYNPGSTALMRTSALGYSYDNKGNVLTVTESNGQTTTYTYDSTYNLPLTATYKQDASTTIVATNTLSTDKKSVLTASVTKNGTQVKKSTYTYSTNGSLLTENIYSTSSGYSQYSYTYGTVSALPIEAKTTSVKNADGTNVTGSPGYSAGVIVTGTVYNARGWPLEVTDADGNTTTIAYDAAGRITRVTNPDNTYASYSYDVANRTTTYTDELGTSYRYTYDAKGNQIGIVDVTSNTTLLSRKYNTWNLLYTETVYDGSGGYSKTKYLYDNLNRPIETVTTDPSGSILYRETYEHAFVTGDLFKTTKTVHGDATSPSIVTTSYSNKMGDTVKTGKFLNGTEYFDTYTYDYVGNVLTELSAYGAQKGLSYTGKWEYDYAGRVTKAYNADGAYSTAAYDLRGNMTSATDFAGSTSLYTYDGLGRMLTARTPIQKSGSTTYYSTVKYYYDPAGNVTQQLSTNNQVGSSDTWSRSDYTYDSRGRLETATMYDGSAIDSVTAYTYDAVGNMLTLTTGLSSATANDGQTTAYTYDRHGNVLTLADPLGQTEEYDYDSVGVLVGKTDRNGTVTECEYDSLGRILLTTAETVDGEIETLSYTYSLTGAAASQSDGRYTITNRYDALGRLTGVTETGGVVKTYGYDIGGNRTSFVMTNSGSSVFNTTYTYDNQSRLTSVTENGITRATYTYDANGNRASLTYANGNSVSYTYNLANWVTNVSNKNGSATVSSYMYSYYADGNQRTKTDNSGRITTYAYDGAGRLTNESETGGTDAVSIAYEYDGYGNRALMSVSGAEAYTVGYEYDANNRLLIETKDKDGVTTLTEYQYDPNGNTHSKVKSTLTDAGSEAASLEFDGDGTELYEYDAFNRMVSVEIDGDTVSYEYRPDGLRLSKTTEAGTTTHLWDGSNIVADYDGTLTTKYLRGIGLIMSSNVNGTKYYLYNAHGDVVQLTDGASGSVVWKYDYDAFGNEREIAGQSDTDMNPFRYCGEYFDSSSGTYYLRSRYYDPSVGRFTSEDTIRSGLNWYTYAANNPIMYVDPSGHVIQLTGTADEQKLVLSYLQQLTDHTLAIADDGTIYVSTFAEKNIKYESGNTLLTRMIDNEHTTSIVVLYDKGNSASYDFNSKDPYNKKGVDATVYFDPNADPDIMTVDPTTGNVSGAKRPNYIGLAHEMIHADRAMRGVAIQLNKTASNKYQTGTVGKYFLWWSWTSPVYYTEKNVLREELATVGLKYANKGDITENMIRAEHGLNLRGAYFGR